jgi:hypothetical protein
MNLRLTQPSLMKSQQQQWTWMKLQSARQKMSLDVNDYVAVAAFEADILVAFDDADETIAVALAVFVDLWIL